MTLEVPMSRKSLIPPSSSAGQPAPDAGAPPGSTPTADVDGWRADGWASVLTGLGTSRDKRTSSAFRATGGWIAPQLADALYGEDDVIKRIITLQPREELRAWIDLPGDKEGKVQRKLDELDVRGALLEARTWARLHGGSLILLGALDGQDVSMPLNEERVTAFDWIHVIDRWDVTVERTYSDPASPKFGMPELYRVTTTNVAGAFAVMTVIHESRTLRFDGTLTSRRRRIQNQGWADSALVPLLAVARDFVQAHAGAAVLTQDFAQAVLKIKGLATKLASDKTGSAVLGRIQVLDMARSLARILPLDAEGEDFERKATPVTGLPELLDRIAQRLSMATDIPVTLLMGEAPAGLNATGDADAANWHNVVSASQESELRRPIARLIKLAAKAAGAKPQYADGDKANDEWAFTFRPLAQPSEAEAATTRKTVAETDAIYLQSGVLDSAEVAVSRFGGDRYSIETVLDTETRAEPTAPVGPDGEPLEGTDIDATAGVEKAQDAALNGAQITGLLEIIKAVSTGDIPKSAGVQLVRLAVPDIDEGEAARMFKDVVEGSTKPEPPPAMPMPARAGGPPGASGKPPPLPKIPPGAIEER